MVGPTRAIYASKSETSGRSGREEKSHSALGRLASSTLIYIKIMCEGMKILWMSGQTDNEKYFLCEAETTEITFVHSREREIILNLFPF